MARRTSLAALAALAAVLGLGLAAALSGAGQGVDRQLREIRDGVRQHAASGDVAIIEIDAKSLGEIDRWPWPRVAYARLIDRVAPAKPRSLVFDVDFSAVSNLPDDLAFASALQRFSGGAVLPTFRQKAGSGDERMVESLPIPVLRAHAFMGSVNVLPDPDGYIRSYSYGVATAGVPRPAIGALLAERPGRINETFPIDFSIKPSTIPRFSFVDVMDGVVDPAALRGKRLIVGATAIELGDRYAVPRYGVQPGVVIQALAAETLLEGSAVPNLGPWPLSAIALIAAAGVLLARGWRLRFTWLAVGIFCVLGLPLALEAGHLATLEAAPGLAMLALAAGLRGVRAVLDAMRRSRLVDAESGLPNAAALVEYLDRRTGLTLAAARIGRFDEASAVLSAADRAALIGAVVDRLRIAAGAGQIYRTDKHTFMWAAPDDGATDALDGLAALFRSPIHLGGRSLVVKPSFGFAARDGQAVADLAANAALAAARAGQSGQVWANYDEALAAEAHRAVSLLADLERALTDGQIWVAFQPKLDMASDRIIGAEALVRWNHPLNGALSPAVFVPLLEAEGHAGALTLFVLDRVLEQLAGWSRIGRHPSVAINVSASLLSDPALAETFEARIAAAGVDPSQIVVEVTESAAIACAQTAVATLVRLREAGLKISVDDYGTGQSTLSYLKSFPAHEIKIDQSFIANVTSDRADQILVRSTIELAHALGLGVVAEGIEDRETLDMLRAFGCDVGQGWLIGRPGSAGAFIDAYEESQDRAAEKQKRRPARAASS